MYKKMLENVIINQVYELLNLSWETVKVLEINKQGL